MTSRKTALVVCPGRGTYNKSELGYLSRHHGHRKDMLSVFEGIRTQAGQVSVEALDAAERYQVSTHTRGDNASLLIHACAYGDFLSIDNIQYEPIAITGNSMGWYIALACAGAVTMETGARIVNGMGTIMQEHLIGGQFVYPLVDENWIEVSGRRAEINTALNEINTDLGLQVFISIELGGMIVFAGSDEGLAALKGRLPVIDRFPLELANHAAFHTGLQAENSARGFSAFAAELFDQPSIPLIDGRGKIWHGRDADPGELHNYTFGHQVVQPFDFTQAIVSGVREFAPDKIIVLGPGSTLGGAIAQSLIGIGWMGLSSKGDFDALQANDPFLLAMGRADQRAIVTPE